MSLFLQQAPSGLSSYVTMLPYLAIIVIFYFLLLRPMQKQKREQQKMLADLKNGDQVVTTGGIVGTIVALNEDETLYLRVKPDNVKIQVARSAVSSLASAQPKA
jgi:preprotein translocase subunit YajC